MTPAQRMPARPAQAASPTRWRVEIVTGPNAGASVPLECGRHSLGQHRDNDIVLADPAMAGRQAVISVAGRCARVETLGAGATLRGRILRPGASLALRDGSDVVLGNTRLRLHGPAAQRRWLRVPLLAAGAVAAAALTIAPQRASRPAGQPEPQAIAQSEPQAIAQSEPQALAQSGGAPAPGRPSLAAAVDLLRARLAAQHLGDAVSVLAADGAVLATGAVLPGERERWLSAQMWFDGAVQGRVALLDRVTLAREDALPKLDVRAVSAGAVPFVITGSGDRYTEGSVLAGGWTISRIAADRITLRHGTRSMDITL